MWVFQGLARMNLSLVLPGSIPGMTFEVEGFLRVLQGHSGFPAQTVGDPFSDTKYHNDG